MSEDRAAEARVEQEQDQDQAHQMAMAIARSRASAPPPPTQPPVMTSIPSVQPETGAVVGTLLTCTMGNWEGKPTSYAYQWKRGSTDIGDGSPAYTAVDEDAGQDITCVVTATNAAGSTVAAPSNVISIPAA